MRETLWIWWVALRALAMRRRRSDPAPIGLLAAGSTLLVYIAAVVLADLAIAGWDSSFRPAGVSPLLASTLITLCAAIVFSARRVRTAEIAVTLAVLALLDLVLAAGIAAGRILVPAMPESWLVPAAWAAFLCMLAVPPIWTGLGLRTVYSGRVGASGTRPGLRALGAVLAFYLTLLVPISPMFQGRGSEIPTFDVWAWVAELRANSASGAEPRIAVDDWAAVELAQPAHLAAALHDLPPTDPVKPTVFVLTVSGWAEQGVFLREARASADVLNDRFGTGGRTLLLANSYDTEDTQPLASLANLASALAELGKRMDPNRDVLAIVMTSHGSRSGFALSHGGLIRRMLSPTDLKAALDGAGIRNRIIVVSACFSGAFVPVLADDDTAVFSAAAADRTSFGCSDERDWTYFGDAFFNRALRAGGTMPTAFAEARSLIADWERRDGVTASDPQMWVGGALATRFPELLGGAPTAGPARNASIRQAVE